MEIAISDTTGSANTYYELPWAPTRFDPSDFDGDVSIYFEASIQSDEIGSKAYVQLYDHTDGVAIAGSQLVASGETTYPKKLRSGPLSLSGDKIYTIQIKNTVLPNDMLVSGARLVVIQSGNITKTQIHQEIGIEQTSSSTSSNNIITGAGQFLYQAANYDGTVTVRHDACVIATSGNTTTAGIYDVTSGSVVSGSEVTTTGTSYVLQSSGNITLTDGHVYSPTSYISGGSAVFFETSKLVFTITGGFTKYLAYLPAYTTNNGVNGSSNGGQVYPDYNTWVDGYLTYNTSQFLGCNVTTYYEAVIAIASAGQTAYSNLEVYVYAVSANNVTGTDVSVTSTTPARARSSSFDMPTGNNDYSTGIASSSGSVTAVEYSGYIIQEVTNFGLLEGGATITGAASISGLASITYS